jgi:RNA-directed DNA polymerase
LRPNIVSTRQERIAKLARDNPAMVFTTLNHYIDHDWMLRAYELTRKDGAAGVDGQTSQDYAKQLDDNLKSLIGRLKSGQYKAPPVRRVYIPKPDGTQRPLGVASFEDKVAQRAITMLLEPIYEQIFKNYSFGFRPGKSAHQALEYLRNQIMDNGGRWIIDVDIQKYFDTIDKTQLRKFLNSKVTDGVIRKLIDKWLKAGIWEDRDIHYQTVGTVQGGVASPLLSNIYLHYVLDEWFTDTVLPRMEGSCSLTRYCDDLVMVFESIPAPSWHAS